MPTHPTSPADGLSEPERAQDVGGQDQALEVVGVGLEMPGEPVHPRAVVGRLRR